MVWQGNGMGAAWERHATCESAFTDSAASFHFSASVRHLQSRDHCRTWPITLSGTASAAQINFKHTPTDVSP